MVSGNGLDAGQRLCRFPPNEKNMKKTILISLAMLTLCPLAALSQDNNNDGKVTYSGGNVEKSQRFSPKRGDWSIGVSFNPATLSYKLKMQPKNGEFAGEFIEGMANSQKQMFILSQDPLAAFRFRYFLSDKWAFRAALGLNGSHIDYREYVDDDLAKAINPESRNQVVDAVVSNLNNASLAIGFQYMAGKGPLKFIAGFGLTYSIAGGSLKFNYGNELTSENRVPSSMPMTRPATTGGSATLNDFKADLGIDYARPTERYNVGYIQGLGVNADMGVEWFMTGRLSLSGAMTFTPVMFTLQPQTWTKYEGFSSKSGKVEQYNARVSPGSHAVLYGTENIGFNIALNYFF